jgi:RNA polymerase sigma-70 factor (ECF subfamily)
VETTSDDGLVARARAGEPAAFEALMHRHYADCLRYAFRMLGDRGDAEDAVQETFVRAFAALARYDERDRFHAWLLRILRNRCRSLGARRAWRQARLRIFYALSRRADAPDAGELTVEDVQRALQVLPARLREAFLLKHVEELSYEEMERITGASESALKMRVKRARAALERILREDGG